MKVAPWVERTMMAIALVPIILLLWYFYSINAVMVAEVVPQDRGNIPIPAAGERVQIYGEWVRDEGHVFGEWYNWHEIHPVRYLKNRDTGEEGGTPSYSGPLGAGAWNRQWLIPIDSKNPFRRMTGIVVETFPNEEDGDVHIHILPDPEYQNLVRYPATVLRLDIVPLLEFYELDFGRSVALMAGPPLIMGILYLVVSIRYPKETILGRFWKGRT